MKLIHILLFLFPISLFSQSVGGFGFRNFANTTTLNNVAPSNIDPNQSKNGYVQSNKLYYVWDGNSWEREEDIDTLSLSGTTLSISLYGDGVPAKTVDLSTATGFGVNIFNSDGVQDDLERYYDADSTKVFAFGQFPDFPDINFDGREKGFFYSPDAYNEVSIYNGNGVTGDYAVGNFYSDAFEFSARDGNNTNNSSSSINFDPSLRNRIELNKTGTVTSPLGSNRIWQVFNDTLDYIAIGHDDDGSEQAAYFTVGIGGNNGAASFLNKNNKRAFSFQTYNSGLHAYNWFEVEIPSLRTDTIQDNIKFYNGSYSWDNTRPSNTIGDTTVHVWIGDGSGITEPKMILLSNLIGSSVNIFNSDGTQDDADRYFTIDSSQTFAMGQFGSFPASTWGRGFYYDPSQNDGIRILNKDGSNTSAVKIELDPFNIRTQTDYLTSDATTDWNSVDENASFVTTVDRTSDTYSSLNIAAVTNSLEEQVAFKQGGKLTNPSVVMYLGDGYVGSQYGEYASRAWGVQTKITGGGFDWLQVLLPDTATDTTGNNINFYNRKYYWSNEFPSATSGDTSVHVWIGNGTTTTPDFVEIGTLFAGAPNIYNSNGTTTNNTRTATILESIQWVGTADFDEPFPFQVHSTGTEPNIQLWKGNQDSTWIRQGDSEYMFGSSAHLIIQSDDYVVLQGDSIQFQGGLVKTKMKHILGESSIGTIGYFDGDAELAGSFITSDGTDWLISTDLLGTGAATFGTSTLAGGTVTVNTTSALTNSVIIISRNAAGGTPGDLRLGAITNGTSFVINSASGTDTSTVNWWILN